MDDVPKEKIVGSLGDHASFDGTYLKNNLIVYDKKDIDKIMSGKKKELSCGYRYTPVRESGEYEGQHYDFKMTDIIGNHVALVKQGRAGRDVMVADTSKGLLETIKEKILAVFDNDLVGDEFVESEHPRAENGQFTSKGGSSGGSVSGDYLPLTGGTLTSSSAPLTINRDSSGKNSGITYQVQGTTVGILGFNPDGYLLVRPHASINDLYYYVLHHKNFSEYALPLTGGTLTGNLTISGTDASSSRIDFTRDGYSYITGKTLSFGPSTDTIDRMLILTSGSATFQCNILPSATKTYSIGSWDNFFKNASINAIYSGASSNNLWLVGGNSTDAYGVVIGRNGTAATSGAEICRFNANGMVWASGVYGDIRTTDTNIYLRRAGLNTNTVLLANGYFSPYSEATDLLQLGRPTARWKGVFVGIGTTASNEYGLQFCDTSNNYVGRISHSANMGIYSTGDIIIRGGCTKGTSNLTASSTGLRVYASGDILVTGGITMYSDQRKKTILNHVELSLKQIADAPLIEHYYNSDQDKTIHVGSIAQYWAELNNWFC